MNKKLSILLFCITLITTTFLVINYIKNNKDDNYQEIVQDEESEDNKKESLPTITVKTHENNQEEDIPIVPKNKRKSSYWPKIILALIIFVVVIALIFIVYLIKNSPSKEEEKSISDEDMTDKEKVIISDLNTKTGRAFKLKEVSIIPYESNATYVIPGNDVQTAHLYFFKVKINNNIIHYTSLDNQKQIKNNYLLYFALSPIDDYSLSIWKNDKERNITIQQLRQLLKICVCLGDLERIVIGVDNNTKTEWLGKIAFWKNFRYPPENDQEKEIFDSRDRGSIKVFTDRIVIHQQNSSISSEVIFQYVNQVLDGYYNTCIASEKIPLFNGYVPFENMIILIGVLRKISMIIIDFCINFPFKETFRNTIDNFVAIYKDFNKALNCENFHS